ncbi:MAG: hypothetical protein GEU98_15695 [Pseudonocardiaceae bacterium]|nr:hypothetical protein [Pseudonocardiaceae bacterium]
MTTDNCPEATAALEQARRLGFRFTCLSDDYGITALCGERPRVGGAIDMCMITDIHEALAMRFRLDNHGRTDGGPVWKRRGTVAEVIADLLALPPPGAPGAPTRELRPPSDLWLPHGARR